MVDVEIHHLIVTAVMAAAAAVEAVAAAVDVEYQGGLSIAVCVVLDIFTETVISFYALDC